MNIIDYCLKKPTLVAVVVFFVIASGIWALLSIPIQLTPDVEKPKASVRTRWVGASPYEIEREIIAPQEEHLTKLPHLVNMESRSRTGRASITMEFEIGSNMDELLPRIMNELNQVGGYPENTSQPTIILSGANSSPVVWIQIRATPGNPRFIRTYKNYVEDVIHPELERIPGIAEARIYGGRDEEVQVSFDPERLAFYGVTLTQLIRRIRAENQDVSGGTIDQGKWTYTVRTVSPYKSPEDLGNILLRSNATGNVYLRDVARVALGNKPEGSTMLGTDGPAMIIPVYREIGSNVLDLTQQVKKTVERMNQGVLKRDGLTMKVLSDPSFYINSAINLVLQNLLLGGMMAILVLYLFLGNLRSSLVIALTIPISLIGTFVFLKLAGRNINVISLAGLAFAVGMVMDAAIVVLENIDTWRKKGHSRLDSLLKATQEVYGAILASSLTTVAVFLPVVFVKDEAGQLFKDIALAIVFSILLSFIVSTTVIPPLYRLIFDRLSRGEKKKARPNPYLQALRNFGKRMETRLVEQLHWLQAKVRRKVSVVVFSILAALLVSYLLAPKQEYLPGGNRNLLISLIFPPPGYSEAELIDMGDKVFTALKPAIEGKVPGLPEISRVFFVSFSTNVIIGTVAVNPDRVKELIPLLNETIANLPGVRGFTSQTSIFERGLGAGRSIDVEIFGNNIEEMAGVTQALFFKAQKVLPGARVRPIPSFDLGTPEIRIVPNIERAAAAGLTTEDLGLIVDIYTDGRKIDDLTMPNGRTLDLSLVSGLDRLQRVEDFENRMLLAPNNQRVSLGAVASVQETVGPNEINHIAEQRAFVLRVVPPADIALETTLDILENKLLAPARMEFSHIDGLRFNLSGTADAFTKTRQSLQTGFILAIGITFLLLVILFEDMLSPLVILAALPIAAAGGFIALALINLFITEQPLDMLTMLGFLMMIGIVVNNPILIISKALSLIRAEGWALSDAVVEAARSRMRPIFMTTATSLFGLMPLVLMPGAGSELYRGLGAAVLGGLALSTLISMIFVPCLFSLIQDFQAFLAVRHGVDAKVEPAIQPTQND